MNNPWKHADEMLRLKPGAVVMVSEPVSVVNMRAGGLIKYQPGQHLRVKGGVENLLWCQDENENSVSFDRAEMRSLDAVREHTD